MNFRSLLIILYLFLIFKSGIIQRGVSDPIRSTPRVHRGCRHSHSRTSDDERSDHFGPVRPAYWRTPRVRARLSLYKRNPKAADSFANFLSSLSRFASFCVPEISRSPGIVPEARGKSRDPEDPEKCGSRAEALPARSSIFVEIFQIC